MFKDKKYYGEFLNSEEKISTNILANRLEKLELLGLISKATDKDNHTKRKYTLTEKGIDLMPMLLEMIAWGAKYDTNTDAPAEFINKFKTDKTALLLELKKNL